MKLALALAALLGATAAQAADLNCKFDTSLGQVDAVLADNGQGVDKISFKIDGASVGQDGACQAENSLRFSTIRCPVFVNRETRMEFYRAFFPRRTPQVKYSLIVWSRLSSKSPRVENLTAECTESSENQ